jgi:hypothetical protein
VVSIILGSLSQIRAVISCTHAHLAELSQAGLDDVGRGKPVQGDTANQFGQCLDGGEPDAAQ